METVKSLRQKGYKVRVFHTRRYIADENGQFREPHPTGGSTEVQIYQEDKIVTQGDSRCSDKENYDRKKGTRIALGRALDKLPFNL